MTRKTKKWVTTSLTTNVANDPKKSSAMGLAGEIIAGICNKLEVGSGELVIFGAHQYLGGKSPREDITVYFGIYTDKDVDFDIYEDWIKKVVAKKR